MSDTPIVTSSSDTAPLSDTQYFVLWGIGTVTCIFSWFGSLSIIYIARRKVRTSIYHRLLFIVSAIDFITQLWSYWNPLLMNNDTGYILAMGNQATCTSVGFATMFGINSKAFFSFYIALYFMLSVRCDWSDQRVMRFEGLGYLFALIIPMSYGSVAFVNQAFNPNEFRYCAIAKYPIGCDGDECIRGNLAPLISTLSTCTTLFVSALAILCTVLLFCFVRQQTKQSARHAFVGTTSCSSIAGTNSDTGDCRGSTGHIRNNQKQDDRSRLVRTQSIFYTANNVNNFIWLIIFNRLVLNSLDTESIHDQDTVVFTSGILLFLFKPLHGFFNFCIYCYPRFWRIKKHFPNNSWWWCLRLLYTKDEGESEIVQQRLLQRHRLSRENLLESSFGALSYSSGQEQPDHQRIDASAMNGEKMNDSGVTKIALSLVDDDVDEEAVMGVLAEADQADRKESYVDG